MARGEYLRWDTTSKIPLILNLQEYSGEGCSGKSPEVSIRRYRETDGSPLDGYFWNGVDGFQVGPNWIVMTEQDSVALPGLYTHIFDQDVVGLEHMYLVYYRHALLPVGFAFELHVVTNDVYSPIQVAEPVIFGNNVLSELARIKDGNTGNFDVDRDSLYHLNVNLDRVRGLLHDNSIVDMQVYDTNNQLTSARLRVFDSAANLPSAPGGNETTGLLFEYTVSASYLALGILEEYKMERLQ